MNSEKRDILSGSRAVVAILFLLIACSSVITQPFISNVGPPSSQTVAATLRLTREDELFLVLKGNLRIDLRDDTLRLGEGELAVIPRGAEHRPVADREAYVLLVEPKTTVNTGDVQSERTVRAEWI